MQEHDRELLSDAIVALLPRPHLKLVRDVSSARSILLNLVSLGHVKPDPIAQVTMTSPNPFSFFGRRYRFEERITVVKLGFEPGQQDSIGRVARSWR